MRTEVMYLMAHLVITLAILAAYVYGMTIGEVDETLKNLLLIIGGYWFGAMGADKIKGMVASKKEEKK
jgi:hypothetical protein